MPRYRRAPTLPDTSFKPAWETSSRPTGWLVGYRAVLQNLRTIYKLKLPHIMREELTK
jgi:hypothetical protein